MKHLYTALSMVFAGAAYAQCTFTPIITPDPVMTCPVGFTQVYVEGTYDSYQWFENGQPITGAIYPMIEMDGASIGNNLTVQCTLDGCTEMSAPVLVDGWIFLLPYVIHGGDEPNNIGFEGEMFFCEGDTALLVMGQPYTTTIQWTLDGMPIPGATNDTLVVTSNGYYSASGAPEVCPGYIQPLGLELGMFFLPPTTGEIVEVDGQLCIYPTGAQTVQWYLNGAPIVAGECFTPTITGIYTVATSYEGACGPGMSAPYDFFLGITDHGAPFELLARPNPASSECSIAAPRPLQGPWYLMDAAGRHVASGRFTGCTACTLGRVDVEAGNYLLRIEGQALRIAVVR